MTRSPSHNATRLDAFDFLRATEMAAFHPMQWIGKRNKEAADEAVCDIIRSAFDLKEISGELIMGVGLRHFTSLSIPSMGSTNFSEVTPINSSRPRSKDNSTSFHAEGSEKLISYDFLSAFFNRFSNS